MMIPKGCKRLAEVDFPIAEVSKCAVEDLPVAPQGEHCSARNQSATTPGANGTRSQGSVLLRKRGCNNPSCVCAGTNRTLQR